MPLDSREYSREYSLTGIHVGQLADHNARTVLDPYNPILSSSSIQLITRMLNNGQRSPSDVHCSLAVRNL